MEKQYFIILTDSDLAVLASVFDIAFRTKGLEAANPKADISLLLKKIQDTSTELPKRTKEEGEK